MSINSVLPINLENAYSSYYTSSIDIDVYVRNGDDCVYISKNGIDSMISHISNIVSNINSHMRCIDNNAIKQYLISLKEIAVELISNPLLKYEIDDFYECVLTEQLQILRTVKFVPIYELDIAHVGIHMHRNIDYLTHHDIMIANLQSSKKIKKEQMQIEDNDIIQRRRECVLQFVHPVGFIDNNGNYIYDNISRNMKIKESILQIARVFRLRYKANNHIRILDKTEYDYEMMKQSKEILHGELRLYYKIFGKILTFKYAIPYAIQVNTHSIKSIR